MFYKIPGIKHLNKGKFFLLAGPCVVESEPILNQIAKEISRVSDLFEIPAVLKASFKKANRSKIDSFTGIGDQVALELIRDTGKKNSLPTLTDVHSVEDAELASGYVDILQIPAFLCRQTDLLLAAGRTGKVVNIKKGQFSSPVAMKFAVDKVRSTGNDRIILTERGTTFGYNDLVVDFRAIPEMKKNNIPVVLDITHSLQEPNQSEGVTGGRPEFIETLAKAGIAAGVDGIFLETHPDPINALSDSANMLNLNFLEELIRKLLKIHEVV